MPVSQKVLHNMAKRAGSKRKFQPDDACAEVEAGREDAQAEVQAGPQFSQKVLHKAAKTADSRRKFVRDDGHAGPRRGLAFL